MKKKTERRYGKNFSNPRPIVVCAISSLTKMISTSKKLVIPFGIIDFLYLDATKENVMKTSSAASHIKKVCFVGVISIP